MNSNRVIVEVWESAGCMPMASSTPRPPFTLGNYSVKKNQKEGVERKGEGIRKEALGLLLK